MGTVYWDPTGDVGTDAVPLVLLSGIATLLISDFQVA